MRAVLREWEFSESLFQESRISAKIPEVITPPTEIIEQIQSPPKKTSTAPLNSALPEIPKESLAKPTDDASQENFDFFGFESPVPSQPEPVPGSTQILMSQTTAPAPRPTFFSSLKMKHSFSKPVRIRFARYVLGVFTVLMFLFMLKMFCELGTNTVQMSPNHVRFSSSHRHHHRV